MSGNKKMNNKKGNVPSRKKLTQSQVILLIIGIIISLIIIVGIIGSNLPRNYYLKDVKILDCEIIEKENYDGENYIKLRPENTDSVFLSEDESWVEVNDTFYNKYILNSKIGVRLDNLDVYKKKFLGIGSGQSYEKNIWSINEVYDNLAAAEIANPINKFTKQATIQKKKITSKGDYFFVVSYDQRSMPVMVEEKTYNKFQVNDNINCDFESVGNLVRLVKVNE